MEHRDHKCQNWAWKRDGECWGPSHQQLGLALPASCIRTLVLRLWSPAAVQLTICLEACSNSPRLSYECGIPSLGLWQRVIVTRNWHHAYSSLLNAYIFGILTGKRVVISPTRSAKCLTKIITTWCGWQSDSREGIQCSNDYSCKTFRTPQEAPQWKCPAHL